MLQAQDTRMKRLLLTSLLLVTASASAQPTTRPDPTQPSAVFEAYLRQQSLNNGRSTGVLSAPPTLRLDEDGRVDELDFNAVPLTQAARAITRETNVNVVPSAAAAEQTVTLYLRDLSIDAAIDALARANGLIVRRESDGNVVRLVTPDEFNTDLSSFRQERTEVFTLLYPNAVDVALAIADLYGNRVRLSLGADEEELLEELEQRFQRFDIIDGRSQGLGSIDGSGNTGVSNFTRGGLGRLGGIGTRSRLNRNGLQSSRLGNNRFNRQPILRDLDRFEDELTIEEQQALEDVLRLQAAQQAAADGALDEQIRRIAARGADIAVTVLRKHNKLVIRTGDEQIADEITALVRRLDVPTPLVLLEVKVLSIELDDGVSSAFDFQYGRGESQGGFTSGNILPPVPPSLIPGGAGFEAAAGVFQFVGDNFRARLRLLQDRNKVTTLASPLILTANAEVSRIFSGRQVPVVVGFTDPQVIVSDGATTTIPAAPVTELQDVGTQLLITANINADRTVTLRILQETSDIIVGGANIPVPTATGTDQQEIDIVNAQTVSGTIVAKDGLPLAFGGLIDESVVDSRQQIPLVGDIPLLGVLFRRETTSRQRSELIVVVRPYVLNTPAESERISREIIEELSLHPKAGDLSGDLGTFDSSDVPVPGDIGSELHDLFHYHSFGKGKDE